MNSEMLPPRLATRLLRWFCSKELLEDVEGDISELFAVRAHESRARATWLYWKDVLLLFRPGIVKNFEINNGLINNGMVRNYLKSTWRNLLKYKVFSAINILSLAIGIATCLAVYLFVQDESSFDSFHTKNVYRLCEVQSFPGTNTQDVALSMPGMGPTMMEDFPEIENFTRFWSWSERLLRIGERTLTVDRVAGVDSTFLQVFDFQLLHGDRQTLLDGKYQVVLTKGIAMALFGEEDVVGRTFEMEDHQHTVTGILADVPENSHLKFNMIVSISSAVESMQEFNSRFGSNYLNTYFILNENADLQQMTARFPDYLTRSTGDENTNEYYELFLQPLADVHLSSMSIHHDYNNYRKFNGVYIDTFILVGLFVLLIAAVNFTNLTTARARNRSKEVGVRKSIGALRGELFQQFLVESIVLAFLALLVAIVILSLALPVLNSLIGRQLDLVTFLLNWKLLGAGLAITFLLGLVAGLYPAVRLSSFKVMEVLRNGKVREGKTAFQSSLVVFQFGLALGMMVCTLVVVQQLVFMKSKDLGFNKDHVMLVDMNPEMQDDFEEIKAELEKKSSVLGVTASGQRLGNNLHQWGYKVAYDTGIVSISPSGVYVDYDYLDVYDIELIAGRTFSDEYSQDDGLSFIINESFAKELGFEDPIGRKIGHGHYPDDSLGTIIGVTKDFNFNSLHHEVNTLVMVVHTEWWYDEMTVRLNGKNLEQGIRDVEEVYGQFVQDYPMDYEFLDRHFDQLYETDQQLGSVISIIATLAILIGCMGLFGLASISIQRRIKEIGIRKVLGASIRQLMVMISKDFLLLILVSFIISAPITYLFMTDWLENFAYRIAIDPTVFLLGGLGAMTIALATISFHVIRATYANPVQALRDE